MTTPEKQNQLDEIGAGRAVPRTERLARIAKHYGVERFDRHLLLCVGPDCCSPEQGLETWEYLKKRVKELFGEPKDSPVYRSKVGCLRVCTDGPICVVYPDGTWYHGVTTEVAERILTEHVLNGRVVEEHLFATNPLAAPDPD